MQEPFQRAEQRISSSIIGQRTSAHNPPPVAGKLRRNRAVDIGTWQKEMDDGRTLAAKEASEPQGCPRPVQKLRPASPWTFQANALIQKLAFQWASALHEVKRDIDSPPLQLGQDAGEVAFGAADVETRGHDRDPRPGRRRSLLRA